MFYDMIVQRTLTDGGYTHSKQGTRYVVGLEDTTVRICAEGFNADHVRRFHSKHKQFGTWLHQGMVELDEVVTFQDKEKALAKAREENQKAIFDLVKKVEIFLK